MARLPRLYAPQTPQLIEARFAQALTAMSDPVPAVELDQLMTWLQQGAQEYKVAVHGWLLLNDRLLMLATPPAPDSIARVIQFVARRFATRLRHGRVFAGRYHSALVEPGHWVLPALMWLETLPVELHYVDQAERWPWSSAAHHTGKDLTHSAWATDHVDYWSQGNTPFARQARYRELLDAGLSALQSQRIQQALFGQWALGGAEFPVRLGSRASRRAVPAARGRPKKHTSTPL